MKNTNSEKINTEMVTGEKMIALMKNRRIVMFLAAVVVAITTYMMILPALSLDENKAKEQGGIGLSLTSENNESSMALNSAAEDKEEAKAEKDNSEKREAKADQNEKKADPEETSKDSEGKKAEADESAEANAAADESYEEDDSKEDEELSDDQADDADENAEIGMTELVTAQDGYEYQVSVIADEDAWGVSEPVLNVTEITEDDKEYDSYIADSAETIGVEENEMNALCVFDIKVIDPETATSLQPASKVKVTIERTEFDEEAAEEEKEDLKFEEENDIQIVHFGEEPEVLENKVDEGVIEFETEGFSVYVVADKYAPLGNDGNEEEETTDDIDIEEGGYFISAQSPNRNKSTYYFMTETVKDGSVTYIRRTAANDITMAGVYHFRKAEGEQNRFYIYYMDKNSEHAHYIKRTGTNSLNFTDGMNGATVYNMTRSGSDYIFTDVDGYHLNLKSKDAGIGFQASDKSDSEMRLVKADSIGVNREFDPYGLNGEKFVIVYDAGRNTGKALVTTESAGNAAAAANVTIRTEDGKKLVDTGNEAITEWTFQAVQGGGYKLKASNGDDRWLVLKASGISIGSESDATAVTVSPGTVGESGYEGKFRFTIIDRSRKSATAIRYNNGFIADTTNSNVQSGTNDWFYLAGIEKDEEDQGVDVTLRNTGYNNQDDYTSIDDNEVPLSGGKFDVYTDENGNTPATDANGAELTGLTAGNGEDGTELGVFYSGKLLPGEYFIEQTAVSAGYHYPAGRYRLTIDEEGIPTITASWVSGDPESVGKVSGNADDGFMVTVRNITGFEMPHTGGMGTGIIYLAGSVLVLAAVIGLLYVKMFRTQPDTDYLA